MEEDGEWCCVRCKDDDLANASVQSFGCLVRAFLELQKS